MIIEMMNRKEHLTMEGLQQIVNIKASMNKGLSSLLKAAFPNTIKVPRPLVENQEILNSHWLTGFTSGEVAFLFKKKNQLAIILVLKYHFVFKLLSILEISY